MNIDCKRETQKIIRFIRNTLANTKFNKVVLGLSGGIDSTTSLYLLRQAIPKENIIVAHLYYFEPLNIELLTNDLPKKNIHNLSIKKVVDDLSKLLNINSHPEFDSRLGELVPLVDIPGSPNFEILKPPRGISHFMAAQVQNDKVRFGNISARVRMILLYDLAKKHNALVCGTENKSEYLLGYFTRFGDEASDFEPIRHLYKTQVYELAKYLKVPDKFINIEPTAGLWKDQTDEKEFGFTYKEADQVLHLYFDKKLSVKKIIKQGFKNAEKIIDRAKSNFYKHQTPYAL